MEVKGPVDVAGSGLRGVPESMKGAQILWRGVLVPPEVVFAPETLSAERILDEPNAELRRVMLERVGLEKVLEGCKAKVVHEDQDAGGRRRLVEVVVTRREGSPRGWPAARAMTQRFLVCRCPSTGREYLLRVPPGVGRCHDAAAWVAGFEDGGRYRPEVET
jgi:hypothetical protein